MVLAVFLELVEFHDTFGEKVCNKVSSIKIKRENRLITDPFILRVLKEDFIGRAKKPSTEFQYIVIYLVYPWH